MKRKKRKISLKSSLTSLFFGLVLLCGAWAADVLTTVRLPESNKPPELYANQIQDDLRKNIASSIDGAQQSVLLIIYALTDPSVIASLKKKSEEGVPVTVICDAVASQGVDKKLGKKVTTRKRYSKGLMHQKILIVDDATVWIGSANMTSESLRVHGNLVTAFHCPQLVSMVKECSECMFKKDQQSLKHQDFLIGGQKVEFWVLPKNVGAIPRLMQLINSAEKTIRVAMFTWTRHDLAKAIIAAKSRGVDVQVVIDHYQGHGAGEPIVKLLKQSGVNVKLSQGNALLHHKFMYLDGKVLVNGSANWTKAAFTKNDDCFMILHELKEDQKQRMDKLWEVIALEAQ